MTRAEAAGYLVSRFELLKLDVPLRLAEMKRVLDRGLVEFDDPEFGIALESIRDVDQLCFIFDQLGDPGSSDELRSVAKHLRNDPSVPKADQKDSPGRDRQFELYVAAICQNAGMVPVSLEEPDVTCCVDEMKLCIAAKRVKSRSESTIKRRIGKGIDQIAGQGLPGIVALELTISRNPTNRPIVSGVESQLYRMTADAKSRQFTDIYGDWIQQRAKGTGVVGVLVFDFTLRLKPDRQWGHDGMMSWVPILDSNAQPDPTFLSFYDIFLAGVPNLQDD